MRYIKKFSGLVAIIIVLGLFFASNAGANQQVSLTVNPGFNGVYKYQGLVPVQVTVVNKGPAIAGYLTVYQDNERNNTAYIDNSMVMHQVEVAENETVQVELLLAGETFNNKIQVGLVVGNHLMTKSPVQGLMVRGDGLLYLGISSHEDSFSSLVEGMQQQYHSSRVVTGKTILPQELTDNFFVLQGADLIIITQEAQEELAPNQDLVLKQWVTAGGILLISQGEEDYQHSQGNGLIISTSNDLSDGSFLSEAYEQELGQIIFPAVNYRYNSKYNPVSHYDNYWSYTEAVSIFPNIKAPNLIVLSGVFLLYLLVLAPGMYLVLKKLDKRDLAWIIIPLCSLIVTFGILSFGHGRIAGDGIVQTVTTVDILDHNTAVIRGAGGIVTPRGGSYSALISKEVIATPNTQGMRGAPGSQQVFFDQNSNQHITFNRVEYWSLRNLLLNKVSADVGAIAGQLRLENGIIIGSLKNDTSLDLTGVTLTAGNTLYQLGDWPAGEERIFASQQDWEEYKPLYINSRNYNREYREKLTPQQERLQNNLGNMTRAVAMPVRVDSRVVYDEYFIEKERMAYGGNHVGNWQIQLNGWSKEEIDLYDMVGMDMEVSQLHLVNQSISVDLGGADKIYYPMGSVPSNYNGPVDFQYNHFEQYQAIDFSGSLQVEYHLNEYITVEQLATNIGPQQLGSITCTAFNWQTKEWDDITQNITGVMNEGEVAPYVGPEGLIQLRFTAQEAGRTTIPEPSIQVLGRVKHD